mmetsp:Transcript_91257/g.204268  ORF Transcript_91257/g.204268 Transcript_91257/m.204268 type:complete len:230 (-) Transcript_91257:204-893(-)
MTCACGSSRHHGGLLQLVRRCQHRESRLAANADPSSCLQTVPAIRVSGWAVFGKAEACRSGHLGRGMRATSTRVSHMARAPIQSRMVWYIVVNGGRESNMEKVPNASQMVRNTSASTEMVPKPGAAPTPSWRGRCTKASSRTMIFMVKARTSGQQVALAANTMASGQTTRCMARVRSPWLMEDGMWVSTRAMRSTAAGPSCGRTGACTLGSGRMASSTDMPTTGRGDRN